MQRDAPSERRRPVKVPAPQSLRDRTSIETRAEFEGERKALGKGYGGRDMGEGMKPEGWMGGTTDGPRRRGASTDGEGMGSFPADFRRLAQIFGV